MRFSTKILLLTLAITVGLSAIIAIAVRSEITAREIERANEQIQVATDAYFERLNGIQQRVNLLLDREMGDQGDPHNRAALDDFSPRATADARKAAEAQMGDYIFSKALQHDLEGLRDVPPPAFHALVNQAGETVVATAVADANLQAALKAQKLPWNTAEILGSAEPRRQYLWIDGRLFLAFGIPIRQTSGENPTFAYFVGYAVTDDLVYQLIPRRTLAMGAWFVVDGKVVASATGRQIDPQAWQGLLALAPPSAKPGQRYSIRSEQRPGELIPGISVYFKPAENMRLTMLLGTSLSEALAPLRRLQQQIAIITGVCVLVALVAARWLSRRLAKPVEQLVEGTQRIARGDFSHPVTVRRSDELGDLARSFNEMAVGLAQRDLIKDSLGQFVDPRVAEALLTNPKSLTGRRVVQSVLFSDLQSFASLSETLTPERLVQLLNQFLGASADIVKDLSGYLDKFSGDGVVALWGPPFEPNHATAACRAALRMVELSNQFTDPPLRVRIGIATGEAIVGIIGSESSKKNYTALGDVVNLASRLEGVNKIYGTQILVDAETARLVKDQIPVRRIDIVRVVGRAEPVELYEILADGAASHIDGYQQAMELYIARQWSAARDIWAQIDDPPARAMNARCEQFIQSDPGATWDGVWKLESK
jgi:class 3 adenylate cyclase